MAKQKTEVTEEKNLELALAEINKEFGAGTIVGGGTKNGDFDVIPTGSWTLDMATGIGGLPKGRAVEIVGPESSGKTTLALHVIAEAQKLGGKCAFIDMEHAISLKYAAKIGVNIDELLISQPDWGEQALEVANKLIKSAGVSVVVIDSIAALVPKSEMDGEIGDVGMGKLARVMSQAARMLAPVVEKSNCLLILLNQYRKNIGGYGKPEVPCGGEATKYLASMRIDIRRKNDKEEERSLTTCTVMKNKCAVPFKKAEFYIDWGVGINKYHEVLEMAIQTGVVKKSGSWFSYEKGDLVTKAQGEDGFVELFIDNEEFMNDVKTQIKEKLTNG